MHDGVCRVVNALRAERVAQLRKMFPDVVAQRDSLFSTIAAAPTSIPSSSPSYSS